MGFLSLPPETVPSTYGGAIAPAAETEALCFMDSTMQQNHAHFCPPTPPPSFSSFILPLPVVPYPFPETSGYPFTYPSYTNELLSLSLTANQQISKPKDALVPVPGSRFLHAMQEILASFACFSLQDLEKKQNPFPCEESTVNGTAIHDQNPFFEPPETVESKKEHLLALLQLLDDQYNQCIDEIHTVISAFHAVTDLDPNLHARFAIPTISIMYNRLRERISSHILELGSKEKQWPSTSSVKKGGDQHQIWKPQRGLPEQSVSVLRAWMFKNFLHPYPKDAEKQLLALKSGLTRSQVSNWFINARVRLWKPMIEEMYAEMKCRRNGHQPSAARLTETPFNNSK